MTRDQLIAVVPVHDRNGRPFYVDVSEIPLPWADQFWRALLGSQIPVIEGVARAAYAYDWTSWASGTRYGGYNGPTGLDDGVEK